MTTKGISEAELRQKMLEEILKKKGGGSTTSSSPPPEPEPEVVVEKVVTDDTKTTLGGIVGMPWDIPIFPPFKPEDWDEKVRCNIPKKDPTYVYGDTYKRFATAMSLKMRTMLVGKPGSGKDKAAMQFCADFNIPYFRITGMRNVTPDMIVGHFSMEDGSMKWVPGDAEIVCRYGGMLVTSEPGALPPDTGFCLQSAWESPGYLTILDHPDPRDRMLPLHENTFLVMTSNVRGFGDDVDKYSATNVMDASFLNRVESMQYAKVMDASQQIEALSKKVPGIAVATMSKMVQFGNLLSTGWDKNEIEASWSLRNLIAWGRMIHLHGNIVDGFKDTFFDKLSDKEKGTVKGLWRDVGFRETL